MAIRWQISSFFFNFSCRLIFHKPANYQISHCSYLLTSETQWRWGTKRIRKAQTGWERSTWGPRPWRGASHSTPSCWSPKRCWVTRCSSTGQRCSAKPSIPRFHNRWLSHDHNHAAAATGAQTVIFSCTKARWPTKNERIRKRVTGYEGTSSWAALYVWAGEAGQWYNRMIVSLWRGQVSPESCLLFAFAEKRTGSGRGDVQEQTEEIRNNRALYPATWGTNWGRVGIFQTEWQCRWEPLWLQQVRKRTLFLVRFFMYCYRFWENYE